jgi:hypothetical protein
MGKGRGHFADTFTAKYSIWQQGTAIRFCKSLILLALQQATAGYSRRLWVQTPSSTPINPLFYKGFWFSEQACTHFVRIFI